MKSRITSHLMTTATSAALVSGLVLSTAAFAGEVTLKSADGTINLVGEFIDFKDDNYFVRTKLGDLRISANRVSCIGESCPQFDATGAVITEDAVETPDAVETAEAPDTATSAPDIPTNSIALKSTDGTINLVGEFVAFNDDNYVIRTDLGDLRVSASRVRCEGAACPASAAAEADVEIDVAIAGSDTIGLGLMPLLMAGFAEAVDADAGLINTGAGETRATFTDADGENYGTYLVSATTDSDAFEALKEDTANIGMSTRRISETEARDLRDLGAGNMVSPEQERIVAVDSVVVITHPSNPVQELTVDQLRGIFSGRIKNWNEIGGQDRAINVVTREDDTASHEFFMDYLFAGRSRGALQPNSVAADDQELSNLVYLDTNAIGYVGYAFQRSAKPVTLINECGIATTPDAFSAKTEEYALNRRMYLYNRADNVNDQSQAFLDFAVSEEADASIRKSGFIDLGILRRGQGLTDSRRVALASAVGSSGLERQVIGQMLSDMVDHDRLSTTFRFRTGSSQIDERGELDMQRLISYLETAPRGTKITFVGFTDDVGRFESNRRLAFGRANSVLDEVRRNAGSRLNHLDLETSGYGEVAPSACNASDGGRAINRRVEVWISKDSTS
ncbi:phosphate ABC transporter substrate-binding/OmpA family protein [bacterium]|nr:phosphate ABC transporter substrate-binding/OmpA family protein [bacterium]